MNTMIRTFKEIFKTLLKFKEHSSSDVRNSEEIFLSGIETDKDGRITLLLVEKSEGESLANSVRFKLVP